MKLDTARWLGLVATVGVLGACALRPYQFDAPGDANADVSASDGLFAEHVDAAAGDALDVAHADATDAPIDTRADAAAPDAVADAGSDGLADEALDAALDTPDASDSPDTSASEPVFEAAAPEPTPEPTLEPAPEPTPEPAPEPTLEAGFDASDASDVVDVIDVIDVIDVVDVVDVVDSGRDAADAFDAASDASDAGDSGACPMGTVMSASGCVLPTPAIRRIAPLSGASTATQRPTLRWVTPAGAPALALRLCADRFCVNTVLREDVSGTSFTPTTPLTRGVYFWRLEPRSGPVTPEYATTWQFYATHANNAVSSQSWGAGSDYNGDGLGDYAAGDPGFASGAGAVFLSYGSTSASITSFATPTAISRPSDAPSGFGTALANGDINGDGYVDLLVGAPGTQPSENGFVYVFYGGPIAGRVERVFSPIADDGFGSALGSGGDLNGDGCADVIVGSPRRNMRAGAIDVILGGPTGLLPGGSVSAPPIPEIEGNAPRTAFGASVAITNDMNGDGFGDLLVGAPSTSVGGAPPFAGRGWALLLFGAAPGGISTTLESTIFMVNGGANLRIGAAVAVAGDFDEDGIGDVLIGSPGQSLVLAYLGSGAGSGVKDGMAAFARSDLGEFGAALAGGYDANSDGHDDFVVGAPGRIALNDTGAFVLYLMNTPAPGNFLAGTFTPSPLMVSGVARFGTAVAMLPDTNGDGFAESLVGAPENVAGFAKTFVSRGRVGFPTSMDAAISAVPLPSGGSVVRLGASLGH